MNSRQSGDVFARAFVRGLEIQRSVAFVREQLDARPAGAERVDCAALVPDRLSVSLVEGWRGEICHVAITDARGRFYGETGGSLGERFTDSACFSYTHTHAQLEARIGRALPGRV